VLDLLHRQDRYVARRTCSARRHGLGARTTTLVLCEDRVDGAEVLASVDLARSFPGVRTLMVRCHTDAGERWQSRFCAFVTRNLAALQQLQHLDLLGTYTPRSPRVSAAALGSVAQLMGLRSLGVGMDFRMEAASWSALRSLAQLTSLRVAHAFHQKGAEDGHLHHIAAAAPQLQQLHYRPLSRLGQSTSSLASLRSLASLSLVCMAEATPQVVLALAALPGLTHLGLDLHGESGHLAPQLMQALGQLTGLSSLDLKNRHRGEGTLAPLEALQQLTHLSLALGACQQNYAVLSRLGALRTLDVRSTNFKAIAAAWLHRLQGVIALVHMGLGAAGPIAPIQLAEGCCLRLLGGRGLGCF
jgi:hypothetical protein